MDKKQETILNITNKSGGKVDKSVKIEDLIKELGINSRNEEEAPGAPTE